MAEKMFIKSQKKPSLHQKIGGKISLKKSRFTTTVNMSMVCDRVDKVTATSSKTKKILTGFNNIYFI